MPLAPVEPHASQGRSLGLADRSPRRIARLVPVPRRCLPIRRPAGRESQEQQAKDRHCEAGLRPLAEGGPAGDRIPSIRGKEYG